MKISPKVLGIILLSILILIIVIFLFFILRNTSLLTQVSENDISKNNINPQMPNEDENLDLNTLVATTLKVPQNLKSGVFETPRTMNLPEGFEIGLLASGIDGARAMDFTDENNIVLTAKDAGIVYLIKNPSGEKIVIDSGLKTPHGIDYFEGDLYVGETHQIVVYKGLTEDGKFAQKKVVVANLPTGGHSTRTVLVGPDQKLYVSIGSSCNICDEDDERRASIMQYNLDGTDGKVFASGLRNTVDFIHHETESALQFWGVDNGRDELGDDLPPEEINLIREGQNYGWPYCYGDRINNPEYPNKTTYCKDETQAPLFNMQAHSAPLGITFIPEAFNSQKMTFPNALKDGVFVTFHGSWNRSVPTGYKVVRVDSLTPGSSTINFITGWIESDGAWGRPVGIRFDHNGDMFIADDEADALYKVSFVGI